MVIKIVLVTVPSKEVGEQIAHRAVQEGTAACVNVLEGVTSVYTWNDKVEQDNEFLLIIKTTAAQLLKLEKLVHELHPYDTPEFVALNPEYVSEKYGDWVAEVTSS